MDEVQAIELGFIVGVAVTIYAEYWLLKHFLHSLDEILDHILGREHKT